MNLANSTPGSMHLTSILHCLLRSLAAPRSLWSTLSMGALVIMKSIMVQTCALGIEVFDVAHRSINVDMISSKGKWIYLFVF